MSDAFPIEKLELQDRTILVPTAEQMLRVLTRSWGRPLTAAEYREKIMAVEERMKKVPGSMVGNSAPLLHEFAEGMYVRTIIMPPGYISTTKIHRFSHPAFVLKGTVTIVEEAGVRVVTAPAQFITKPGTKRLVICHDEVVWVTVHLNPREERDTDILEDELTSKTFEEFDRSVKALEEGL